MRKSRVDLRSDVELSLTEEQKKQKFNFKLLKLFFRYYREVWGCVFLTILTMILSAAMSVVMTIFSGNLLSAFSDGFVFKNALKWGLLTFGAAAFISFDNWICNLFWKRSNFSIFILMKNDIMERVNSLDQSCLDRVDALKFLQRIDWDANNTVNKLFDIMNIIINLVSGLAFLSYTLYLNLYVGLFLAVYVFVYALIKYCHNKVRQKNRRVIKSYAYRTNTVQVDNIRGMKDLRGINANSQISSMQENITGYRWSMNYKNSKIDERFTFGANITADIFNLVFIVLCAYMIMRGQLFIAGFMIAYNYKGQIITLAGQIAEFRDEINDCLYSAMWVNNLFDEKQYPLEKFGSEELKDFCGNVEFKDVRFEYVQSMPVLNGISFKVEPKSVVAFVGESGGGKSTIISLINKVYTLKEGQGEVLLDGHNINTLTKDSIRDNICVVLQSPYMFDMTIAENLRLAKSDATDEELLEVLKKAKLSDFVSRLPEKLNTRLGDNGMKLSDGQRQRFAIARALLKNARIIVFDEATSSLDNENQAKIKRIIKSLKKDHTIIIVAHRLSSVEDSNKIFFIKDGQVFAEGTHESLYNSCEEYRNLCNAESEEE